MRKLLFLGAAALLAFKGGKGLLSPARDVATRAGSGGASRLGFGDILSMWFAPPWLRPFMLARVVSARSTQRRRTRPGADA